MKNWIDGVLFFLGSIGILIAALVGFLAIALIALSPYLMFIGGVFLLWKWVFG